MNRDIGGYLLRRAHRDRRPRSPSDGPEGRPSPRPSGSSRPPTARSGSSGGCPRAGPSSAMDPSWTRCPHMADYPDDRPFSRPPSRRATWKRSSGIPARRSWSTTCPSVRRRRPVSTPRRASGRGEPRELHPRVHRLRSGVGGTLPKAGIPLVGDDIKSQLGATIVHRALARLFSDRGIRLRRDVYQPEHRREHGLPEHAEPQPPRVETDLQDRGRVTSRPPSPRRFPPTRRRHIGPSDYVPAKTTALLPCGSREGIRGLPIEVDCASPSPTREQRRRGDRRDRFCTPRREWAVGPLLAPSAYFMKHPPSSTTTTTRGANSRRSSGLPGVETDARSDSRSRHLSHVKAPPRAPPLQRRGRAIPATTTSPRSALPENRGARRQAGRASAPRPITGTRAKSGPHTSPAPRQARAEGPSDQRAVGMGPRAACAHRAHAERE